MPGRYGDGIGAIGDEHGSGTAFRGGKTNTDAFLSVNLQGQLYGIKIHKVHLQEKDFSILYPHGGGGLFRALRGLGGKAACEFQQLLKVVRIKMACSGMPVNEGVFIVAHEILDYLISGGVVKKFRLWVSLCVSYQLFQSPSHVVAYG